MNNSFTYLVKSKPAKQEVSCTAILPPFGECSLGLTILLYLNGSKKVAHLGIFFYFLPLCVPPADTVPILSVGRGILYLKGYHGLLNCHITKLLNLAF